MGALAEAALTVFRRAIPTGLALPIVSGPLRGNRWIVGAAAGEGGGLGVLLNRSERDQLACAARIVKASDVCFDLGANVGLYTVLFARRGARVVAFEPAPRNIRWLQRTVEVNRLGNVTIVPAAVSDGTGLASFDPGENPALGRLVERGSQPVVTLSLDAFVERFGTAPSVMKIDVEGAELGVLHGASRTIEAHRPRILLSTHGEEPRARCASWLRQRGYALETIPGNGFELLAS